MHAVQRLHSQTHITKMQPTPVTATGYGRTADAAATAYRQAITAAPPTWPEIRQEMNRITQSINTNVDEKVSHVMIG